MKKLLIFILGFAMLFLIACSEVSYTKNNILYQKNTEELGDFVITAPINESTLASSKLSANIEWGTSTNAECYDLLISEQEDFSKFVFKQINIKDTFYQLTGDFFNDKAFFIKVIAKNSKNIKPCSSIIKFYSLTSGYILPANYIEDFEGFTVGANLVKDCGYEVTLGSYGYGGFSVEKADDFGDNLSGKLIFFGGHGGYSIIKAIQAPSNDVDTLSIHIKGSAYTAGNAHDLTEIAVFLYNDTTRYKASIALTAGVTFSGIKTILLSEFVNDDGLSGLKNEDIIKFEMQFVSPVEGAIIYFDDIKFVKK